MDRRQFLYGSAALSLMAALPSVPRAFASEGPTVLTSKGALRGRIVDGVHVFRGVPCGMPPYQGKYRLALPEFVPAWNGVVDAVTPGDLPLQFGNKKDPVLGGGDCLRLNIWTPAPGATRCPVIVYIPGGGSISCNNNDPRFNGMSFAKNGVILVTANYRVNVDGFLKIKGVPANLALRDMMFALRWVQDNIAAFGGDPDNVTVYGQSAGATHITSLLSSPLSKGLFRRAILQSPAALAQYDPETSSEVSRRLLAFYGVEDSRDAVAAIPFEKLLTFRAFNAARLKEPEWHHLLGANVAPFKPYYDGEVLLKRPVDAIAEGAARGIDLMVGSTEEEWRWYTVPNGSIDRIGEGATKLLLAAGKLPADLADKYRAAGRGKTAGEVFTALQSDFIFRLPANKVLESQAKAGGKTWAYSFGWKSPAANGRLGAAHSVDLAYTFKTHHVDNPRVKNTVGENPCDALADAMHKAWVSFAKTGDPGWSPFDLEERRTMRFDTESREVLDPWKTERQAMKLA